ncbi:MAG: TRAP transporter large permease [Candidatus Limnocylindrales bacterium]
MIGFLLLAGTFVIAVIAGLPIVAAFLLSDLVFIAVNDRLTIEMVPPILYSALDSFPLLAIPLFIFSGDLMSEGRVSERLLRFATPLIGWIPGHVGAATVLGSMFFGAVSGSGPATTAAIGGMTMREMEKDPGYSRGYRTSLAAASGFLGVLIPPSIPFVMFGFITSTSIGDLFLAGVGPGIILGIVYILWNTRVARRTGVRPPERTGKSWLASVASGFVSAIWALLMPVIIFGGIYGGVFTATEAAAVSVAYAAFVALFIYRTLTPLGIARVAAKSAYTTLTFMLIFVVATVFSRIMSLTGMPADILEVLTSITDNPLAILLLINVVLVVTGMLVDPITGILVMAPLFYPIATGPVGLDPVHFGALMVTNLAVGMITPPMAGNLFVAMRLSGATFREVLRPVMPFVLLGLGVAAVVTYVPGVSLFLVDLLK